MERIKVGVKIRPLIRREKSASCDVHWLAVSENSISQVDPLTQQPKGDPHVFDNVFGPDSSNREVFEVLVKPIVESAVKGFNGTIFAYGQTASGKTYTMMGDQYEPGIIPQAVDMVFQTIEATNGREFLLRVCYMEIYNEKVHDLLNKQNRNLKISEDSLGNVIVKDLEESITSSSQMVMDLMRKGENIRKIGVTNMNERSSRSHSIFRIIIESRQAGGSDVDEAIQVSHLNLVDLAGSERAGATGAVGDQFKEGCAINKSLFTLGKVISQLSDGETSFVNFRDSKLTRILQSSLGGNALTAIICAITPAAIDETSSTLGFASRARNIKTKAQVNEVVSDRAMLKRYVKQIDRLNSALSTLEQQKNAENMHLVKENNLLQERLNRLKDALLGSHSHLNVDTAQEMKLKKLRRRTWSAPHRHTARLSLAFPPLQKTNSIAELPVDRDTSDLSLMNSDNEEDAFCTPLEEFEKALIKAERAKSMDVGEWLPPVEDVDEDIFSKSPEKDFEDPPLSYVQTRRNRGHLKLNEVDNVVYETPPSKLRSKIVEVERELDELDEFTRLEKQLYNEDMSAELERVKTELKEVSAECETLKEVKKQLECMKQTDRTAHDYQMMLMDSTKTISTLRDENNSIKQKLTELTVQCDDMVKLRNKLTDTEHHLSKVLKENSELSSKLKKQDEKVFHLNNEKEDFDIQLQIMISKYEVRMKDMAQALEEARQQSSGVHQTALQKNYNGLYALQEEPSMEELLQQVQFLEEQCKALKSGKDLLVKELASKQANICTLEEQITSLSVSAENSQTLQEELNTIRSELENLRLRETSLVQQLKERDSELATLRKAMDSMKEKLIKFSSCEKTLNADDNNGTEPNSVQYELSGLQSAYEILTQELKEKEEKIVNAAVEMEQLREKILLLEQDVGDGNGQNKVSQEVTLNSSLLKLEEQEALINQVTSCENKIAAQQEKISSLEEHVKILSASADKCQSLEEELCAARTELENLKLRETSLVLQLTEMDQEVTDLKSSSSKLPALMSLNDTLTQELREKEEEILNAAVEMEQLREKIASLEADACRSSDKMLPAQDDSSSASLQMVGEHEKLVDKITACEKIIATQQENISCLEEEKTKLTAIVDSCQYLQQELNDAKIKLEDLKTHHSSLMQELDEKNQTVTELDSVRAEMSSLKLTHTKELKEKDQQIAKAGTEMESLREKVLLLEENVGSSNDQREVLQDSTLDTSRLTFEEQEALINEVTCSKIEIAAQKEKISNLEMEISRLTCLFNTANQEKEEICVLKEELKDLKFRESSLVQQLQQKETELSAQSIAMERLREEYTHLDAVRTVETNLKSFNTTLTQELKEKDKKIVDAAVEREQLCPKAEILEQNVCISNGQKEVLQDATSDTLLLTLEEQEALINEVSSLRKEKTAQKMKIGNLEEEINQLTTFVDNGHLDKEEIGLLRKELEDLNIREKSLVQQLQEKEAEVAALSVVTDELREQYNTFNAVSNEILLADDVDKNVTSELDAVQSEITDLKFSNVRLTKELKEKEEKIVNAAVEMEQLREKILLLEQDVGDGNGQNKVSQEVTLNSSLLKLEEQEALINQVTSCENKIAAQQEKISSLEEHVKILSASADKCQSLEEELCAARTELENLKSRETSLVLQLTEMDQEVTDLKPSSSKLPALMSLNDTLTQELREKEEEILKAAVEMEQLREKILLLEQDVGDGNGQNKVSQEVTLNSSLLKLEEQEALINQVTSCENKIAAQQEKISSLEEHVKILSASADKCQSLEEELCAARTELENLKLRETSLVLQLTEMDQEVTDLKSSSSKLPALMSLNDTLTQELREKEEEILNAAVEMEQLREKIASLEADACRSSDKMLPAQDDSSSASLQMVGEHEKLVDKITACEKIIATQQENISCLEEEKTKLTAIVDSCQYLQQELNDAKIKLEDLKTHHSSLMQELDEKNQTVTELDSVRAEMSSLKLTHTKELQESDQQIAKAGTEMESLREKVLLLEQNVGSSNDQREVLQDSTLDTSRLTFEEQEALINEVTCCKNEIAAQHEKIRSLEAEVTRLTLIAEQYQSLQEENIASRSEIEAIKARENRLVEQLTEKNCELSEFAVTVDKLRDLQNDLVTLKDDNASLLVEVKTKNSVLKDSESELSLLRAKFEALQSSSCNIHEIENLSKDILQQKTEVKALQQKNASLQEEIKYKNTLHMEVEDEVRQLKAKLQELAGSLMKDELCQKCCDLEKVMKNQQSEKKMIEEEMCSLQRQRNDLELEIKSVQKTLVAEVKAISDSSDDLLNASLSDLLSTFLASIMKVQEHVASVFQSKLNSCNSELDAYAQREAELQEKIKLLESDVAQLTDVNCTLNSQLMEAKQQEVLKENLEISFQNLKSLLNCAQDLSQDGVLSVLKSKLIELSSISDNIKDLKTTVDQMKTENNSLSMKIAERDGKIITLNNKLSNMECDAVQSSDYMKRIKEKAEKLELDLSVQKKLVRDLQAEALHTAECLEELDKIKERVKILTDELLTERALKSTLQNEVSAKTQTILDLKESLNELQAKVQTQSKQLSGKESLQCKASSLYNDLTEKKEIILKLEEEIRQNKSSLEEKQAEIGSLFKHIEELKKNLVVVETNLSKVKAERDLAEKNLSLKPSDEVSELKAEIECLRHYHEDAVKSLRETRHKNRKITAELVKTKEKLDAAENSTPGATSEVAHLKELLLEEISKRRQLETQVEEQLKELSQLSRSKPSRSSDFKQKREASDARQVKAELESLKEKYDKLQEQASKSSEVSNLMKVLKEKEELVQEKDQKIADLTKDKDDLDKECEEVLSWGRSIDKEKSELAERFTEVLKDLARTKSTLFSVAMAKVEILKTSCKGDMGAIDKTSKDVLEMQISSKEKSAKNAQSRAETLIKSIKDIEGRKILDHDLLEKLCSDLDKENQFLLDIDSEFATICEKVEREKRQVSECDGCKELLGWGKHQEALAIERDNLVDKLNGELKKLKCKGASKEQVLPQKSLEEISSRGDCKCEELQGLVQTQRTELADKKAEITELKMKQLILNKPAEEKLKRLEEKLKISKEEITNLKLQNRRILKTYQENTECTSSQTVMKKCAYTQTTDSNEQIYKSQYWSGGPSGIVDEANRIALEDKVRKLEREKETYKKLCVERKHRNDLLEDKLKKYLKENQENEPATPYSLRSRKN